MESLSGEPHWAMSMGSSREGMPSSSSATEKTRQQFLSISLGSRLRKLMRSGLNLWTMAQKARPSFQELDMLVMLTPG